MMGRKTIQEIQSGYKTGSWTTLDMTKYYLKRIKKKDPALNSYITVAKDRATGEAKRLEAKSSSGRADRSPVRNSAFL